MASLMGWLGRSAASPALDLTPERELSSLRDAASYTALILNDRYDEADTRLSTETSPFHKFMRGICYFQRATFGTEPEIIKKGLIIVDDAEQTILQYHTHVVSNPTSSTTSDIFPVGTVYELMLAELQMAYAILAIMNANMTNALKALLRIRKAYTTMSNIFQIEQEYANTLATKNESTRASTSSRRRSFDFALADGVDDFGTLSSNPIDHFTHIGLCFSYGMLQWALSIVPAPFDKALAFMSVKGDRKLGHSLMWEATKYPEDIHGALSCFTTLIIYNGLSSRCDIRPADAVPYDRVTALLLNLRRLYPESHKWDVQEAMMLAIHDRKLDEAIEVLQPGVEDKQAPKFVTALCVFEQGCKYLFMHNYDACAKSFIELPKYTDWSVALFHYVVGISYVDAYRKTLRTGGEPEQAKKYAALANESLSLVMGECGKRKVLGRPVPIEVYVKNNMNRYLATQTSRKCTLVEAVDVSPAEELIWLHGAHDSMPEAQLRASLEELESYKTTNDEEMARTALLKAACLRSLGQFSSAREELEQNVLIHTSTAKSWGRHASNWVLPAANYEAAVCLWHEAGPEKQDQAKLRACAEHVRAASKAGGHDLQTFQGIKISTAIRTLKKLGIEV